MVLFLPHTWHSEASLAVAVSGGADSMALALMLKEYGAHVIALHVDHGLRPESVNEAIQVQAWLAARHIPCHILKVKEDVYLAQNIMAAARDARYNVMTQWCHARDVHYLCIAHHAQDQMETFLMRLARGSGIDGLASIRLISERNGITVLRPLLHMMRDEIEAYLTSHHQPWINDPTNAKPCFTRNRLRLLLPALEGEGITATRITQITAHLARASECLNALAQDWIIMQRCYDVGASAIIPSIAFATLHEELALRVVRSILLKISVSNHQEIRFDSLHPLVTDMQDSHTSSFRNRTLHGCIIRRKRESFFIIPE